MAPGLSIGATTRPALTVRRGNDQHDEMKAPDFAYTKPATLRDALAVLSSHEGTAVPLAGGQSLMATLNLRLSTPELVVDLGGLDELRGITDDGDAVRIGALTTHNEVAQSPLVRRALPLLAEAIRHVGHVAIRNRGTLGGSLAYADPAAEMPACCVALDAVLIVAGSAGRREIPAAQFYRGLFETALAPGELIVEIRLPKQTARQAWGFAELSRRHGDFALAGIAAVVEQDGAHISASRVVYFGCADCARLAQGVAAKLAGERLPLGPCDWLADAIAADVQPVDTPGLKARTKVQLATVLTRRTLDDLRPGPAP
jgi:carbon-monoxide dehydrogenase medium subunit